MFERKIKHIYYYRKKPVPGKRTTFSILKQTTYEGNSINTRVFEDNRVTVINSTFLSGQMGLDEADRQVNVIVKELQEQERARSAPTIFNNENLELLERYWKKMYPPARQRKMRRPRGAYLDVKNALEALGRHSLYSASINTIQEIVDSKYQGRKQQRIVACLNSILKFIGRHGEEKLVRADKEPTVVKHLSESEFQKVLALESEQIWRDLYIIAFNGGFRSGEIYGLRSSSKISANTIFVEAQILAGENEPTLPKNKKRRKAFFFDEGYKSLDRWLGSQEKPKQRNRISERFTALCMYAFPTQPDKWLQFRDLRHSYAIRCLAMGMPISLIAQSLGNSEKVCQEHYVGFILSDDAVTAMIAIAKAHKRQLPL